LLAGRPPGTLAAYRQGVRVKLQSTERVMLQAVMLDLTMCLPIVGLGLLSGAASSASEAVRGGLLLLIDVVSLCVLVAINRRRFSAFEFGIEKIQVLVQLLIAVGMVFSLLFILSRVLENMSGTARLPDYLLCVLFAFFSYINMLINIFSLRRMQRAYRLDPSIILRGQIRNRTVMLSGSVAATVSTAMVVVPDRTLFLAVDTIGAIFVLIAIVLTATRMLGSGLLALLDAPIEEREKLLVFREVTERFERWRTLEYVRTRRIGHQKYIEVGLGFDRDLPLPQALAICGEMAEAIRARIDGAFVSVHTVSTSPPAEAPASGLAPATTAG